MMYNSATDNCIVCGRRTFSNSSSHSCSACPNGKDSLEGSSYLADCFHGKSTFKSRIIEGIIILRLN